MITYSVDMCRVSSLCTLLRYCAMSSCQNALTGQCSVVYRVVDEIVYISVHMPNAVWQRAGLV